MRKAVLSAMVVCQLSMVAGCSKSGYSTTDLQGIVKVNGAHAAEGGLTFTPLVAHHGRGVFAPVVDGSYKAKGVAVGPTRVTFQLTKETGRVLEAYGRKVPEVVSIVPLKYQAGLDIELNAGDTERNFELDSK